MISVVSVTNEAIHLRAAVGYWLEGTRALQGEHRDAASQAMKDLMGQAEQFVVEHDHRHSDDPGDHMHRTRRLRTATGEQMLLNRFASDGERHAARALRGIMSL